MNGAANVLSVAVCNLHSEMIQANVGPLLLGEAQKCSTCSGWKIRMQSAQ